MLKNVAAEIMLVDIDEQRCKGEVLDLSDALSFCNTSKIKQATPQQAGQSDIIIIAAGARQQPDQTRVDLLNTNKKIISEIITSLQPIKKTSIIIMISNPVDLLTLHAQELSGLPRNQVIGSGTFLDSQRLRGNLSKRIGIAEQSIHAYILGEHGDTQFPAWSIARIAGVHLLDFPELIQKDLDEAFQETKNKAYDIIDCKRATFYGIAACVSALCDNILFDQKRLVPISCYQPEFGVCLSMPAILGINGIERVLPSPLSEKEQEQLKKSALILKSLLK